MPILSIIIPIKYWNDKRFILLLNSIQFLMETFHIEIIIVYGSESPKDLFIKNNIINNRIKLVHTEPRGIYNAFNVGINYSTGSWVMFFGGDDMLLPSLNNLLERLDDSYLKYNAIVCKVVFGDKGIFSPYKNKFGLIFKNWCQQGVLYNRSIFKEFIFDESYIIQSDHKFNIEISCSINANILYLNDIISFFNTSGLSQGTHDWEFRKDMPYIVKTNFGLFWGGVTILRRTLGSMKKRSKI
jgi:glycosyltransferase involved in cell wall biosynthesis